MKKILSTLVTCILLGIIISSPITVEASAVSIRYADGNYYSNGFGETFRNLKSDIRERLSEGHESPIWILASKNCHTEAEYYFSTDKEMNSLSEEYDRFKNSKDTDFIQVGTYMDNRLRSNLEEDFKTDPQKTVKDVLSSAKVELKVETSPDKPIYWHTEDVNADKFLLEVAVGKYVIEPGDCLSVIAERFNTSVEQLMADNQNIVDPDLIYAGDFLVVKWIITHTASEWGSGPIGINIPMGLLQLLDVLIFIM